MALGGSAGASARYWLSRELPVSAGTFPTTTLVVNVAGAFLLGLLVEIVAKHEERAAWARHLVGVGMLGAFTTFSTFSSEVVLLGRDGHTSTAIAYVAASAALGVAAAASGLLAGGWRPVWPVPDEGES
ncbi:MAG: fluoride efflux transporter CrcB [Acidimicrobiia bacterium]|nr:fluoride efflux transporter CrcB [Acidimicrobiia bacterium]